jgi:hypothetical protein
MEGQRAVAEVCLIPWSAGVVRKDDFAAMEKAESMIRAISGGMGFEAGGIRAELDQAPGFPGRTVEIDEDGNRGEEEVLVKVERGSIPPDRFGPPAGFREGPSPF